MYADRGAVVPGIYLPRSKRGVTLIAERLPLVGAHFHSARCFEHGRKRQIVDCDVIKPPSIKES